jgi:hypothetical protein
MAMRTDDARAPQRRRGSTRSITTIRRAGRKHAIRQETSTRRTISSHNTDVANAHSNPLTHFLQFGQAEGRSPFADGAWG